MVLARTRDELTMQEGMEAMLRSRFADIHAEEEKAREDAWCLYLAQHAHDFSGSSSTSLPALASLGIDIVISMVSVFSVPYWRIDQIRQSHGEQWSTS